MARGSRTAVLEGRAGLPREWPFLGLSALLFVVSAGGTIYWCGSMSGGMVMAGGWTMSMAWMRMPGQTWLGAAASFMGMWVVMMVAMMLPSLVPMLSTYRRAILEPDTRLDPLTALVGAGYFCVWAVIGAGVYPLGVFLAAAEMRWPTFSRSVPVATGIVLLIAGYVQLTRWKARQLGRCCLAPVGWRLPGSDARRAWQHGLHLGVACSLCCSGFMMILLVSGVMDLRVMMTVAAAITVERLAPRPERAARVVGVLVIAAGALVLARAFGAA